VLAEGTMSMGSRSPREWAILGVVPLKSIGSLCCSVGSKRDHSNDSILNNSMTRDAAFHRRNFRGFEPPVFLDWEDGPPLYKYTKSKILLGPPHFSDQSCATAAFRQNFLTFDYLLQKKLKKMACLGNRRLSYHYKQCLKW